MSLLILTVGCIIQQSNWSHAAEGIGDLVEEEYSISTSSPLDKIQLNSIKHILMLSFGSNGTGVFFVVVQVKWNDNDNWLIDYHIVGYTTVKVCKR